MRTWLLLAVGVLAGAAALVAATRGRSTTARALVLRRAGVGLLVTVAGLSAVFGIGEVLADPGGWRAVALLAAWVVPLGACCAVAWWRPGQAVWLLVALTGVVLTWDLWVVVDPAMWRRVEEGSGPVHGIATLALVVAVGVLGLQRSRAAGVLLVFLGVGSVISAVGGVGGRSLVLLGGAAALCSGLLFLAASRATPPATGDGARAKGPLVQRQ